MSVPFHLSFCVADLGSTRAFYGGVLGCREGEATATYVDFSFYGNQLTCHLAPRRVQPASEVGLDGNHFGAILSQEEFKRLAAAVSFITEPETQHRAHHKSVRR